MALTLTSSNTLPLEPHKRVKEQCWTAAITKGSCCPLQRRQFPIMYSFNEDILSELLISVEFMWPLKIPCSLLSHLSNFIFLC